MQQEKAHNTQDLQDVAPNTQDTPEAAPNSQNAADVAPTIAKGPPFTCFWPWSPWSRSISYYQIIKFTTILL